MEASSASAACAALPRRLGRRWRHFQGSVRAAQRPVGLGREIPPQAAQHRRAGRGSLAMGRGRGHGLVGVVLARHDALRRGDRDLRALGIEGGIKRLLERHRIARNQRQLDILPIAAGQVLDHAPALQARLAAVILRQHQPVGGLPDRRGHDIAEADGPRGRAEQPDGERALVLGPVLRQAGQRAVDLRLRLRIGEADRRKLLHDRLHDAAARSSARCDCAWWCRHCPAGSPSPARRAAAGPRAISGPSISISAPTSAFSSAGSDSSASWLKGRSRNSSASGSWPGRLTAPIAPSWSKIVRLFRRSST